MINGYAVLDLTKYDLDSIATNFDVDAVDITKEEFDNIINTVKTSYANNKPLIVKTGKLYDEQQFMMSMPSTIYIADDLVAIPYTDLSAVKTFIINIKKVNDKYLIGVSDTLQS